VFSRKSFLPKSFSQKSWLLDLFGDSEEEKVHTAGGLLSRRRTGGWARPLAPQSVDESAANDDDVLLLLLM